MQAGGWGMRVRRDPGRLGRPAAGTAACAGLQASVRKARAVPRAGDAHEKAPPKGPAEGHFRWKNARIRLPTDSNRQP